MRVSIQIAIAAALGVGAYVGWTQFMTPKPAQPGSGPQAAASPGAAQPPGAPRPAGAPPAGGAAPAGAPRPGGPGGPGGAVLVEVASIMTGPVIETNESVGTTRALESVTLTAKVSGVIEKVRFEEGQTVKAGDVLVELDTAERQAEVETARAAITTERAKRDETAQKLERAIALRKSGAGTEALVADLTLQLKTAATSVTASEARERTAMARLDDLIIRAPFSGRVGLRQVSLGAFVDNKVVVTTLDDISKVRLDFSIPEPLIARIRVGSVVQAESIAYIGRKFEGTVAAIDTRIDPVTRSAKLTALIENSDFALKPGMFMTVALQIASRENALLAHEEGIVAEGPRQLAFVVKDNKIERRVVLTGQRQAGKVEIIDGLKAGDVIVVRGIQRVRNGMTVTTRPAFPAQPATGAAPAAPRANAG